MTAFGSEDIAVQALQRGAASYVSKSRLAAELEATIHSVLAVANAERRRRERIDALTDCRFGFSLEPHMEDLDAVVWFIQN
jgi:DNA-binding NtrC family response regulator